MIALLLFMVLQNPLVLTDGTGAHHYVLSTRINGRSGVPICSFQFHDDKTDERLSFEVKRKVENGSIVQVFGVANWQCAGKSLKRVKAWFWYDGKTAQMKPFREDGQTIQEEVKE